MRRFLKKPQGMLVHKHIACVIEINNYLKDFPPAIVGGNTTKIPDNELMDLLEFGIPIKWQHKIQVQNFEPMSRTLRDFQDFCKQLETALEDLPADNKPKQASGQEKGIKKLYCNKQ